jgi:hypothetical protein
MTPIMCSPWKRTFTLAPLAPLIVISPLCNYHMCYIVNIIFAFVTFNLELKMKDCYKCYYSFIEHGFI